MANAAVVECYATLVDPFGSTAGRNSPHRGADYRRSAGQAVVAYEACTVVDSDLKSQYLGYSLTAQRHRDGMFIGWSHLVVGTRPGNGTVLQPGDQVGLVAGFGDYHGSSWTGPHIHTTEGPTPGHIYSGTVTDPAPDIAAARGGTAGGGGTPVVNYHWWQLTAEAMKALQQAGHRHGTYSGPDDGDFGELSVKSTQQILKDIGLLPGDYEVDGIPHNPDQEAPSNYGYALQDLAITVGYDGIRDGRPGSYTSQFLVPAANALFLASPVELPPVVVVPPLPVPPLPVPPLPVAPEGFIFMPDLATSQSTFDFTEYNAAGGRCVALKMGGGNASDSPYTAPAYEDQFARAVAQHQRIVHYWFNGRKNGLTPEASADYFATHSRFRPGDIAAMDVENETDTDTTAWTPDEAVAYAKQLDTHFPGIKGLAYMSDSLADSGEWDELVALGWELWSASWGDNDGDPNVPPVTDDWPHFTAWQYTSEEKVPGNYSGNPKLYLRTDGNLVKADMWDRLGWKLPVPEPEPEPEPTPPGDFVPVSYLTEYLSAQSQLNAEFAAALNK